MITEFIKYNDNGPQVGDWIKLNQYRIEMIGKHLQPLVSGLGIIVDKQVGKYMTNYVVQWGKGWKKKFKIDNQYGKMSGLFIFYGNKKDGEIYLQTKKYNI